MRPVHCDVHGWRSGLTEQWAIRERRLLDDRLAKLIAHSWAYEGRSFDASAPAVAARLVFGMLSSVVDWYRPGHGPFDAELLAELADQRPVVTRTKSLLRPGAVLSRWPVTDGFATGEV